MRHCNGGVGLPEERDRHIGEDQEEQGRRSKVDRSNRAIDQAIVLAVCRVARGEHGDDEGKHSRQTARNGVPEVVPFVGNHKNSDGTENSHEDIPRVGMVVCADRMFDGMTGAKNERVEQHRNRQPNA